MVELTLPKLTEIRNNSFLSAIDFAAAAVHAVKLSTAPQTGLCLMHTVTGALGIAGVEDIADSGVLREKTGDQGRIPLLRVHPDLQCL
jgi:hypothetical protein